MSAICAAAGLSLQSVPSSYSVPSFYFAGRSVKKSFDLCRTMINQKRDHFSAWPSQSQLLGSFLNTEYTPAELS